MCITQLLNLSLTTCLKNGRQNPVTVILIPGEHAAAEGPPARVVHRVGQPAMAPADTVPRG